MTNFQRVVLDMTAERLAMDAWHVKCKDCPIKKYCKNEKSAQSCIDAHKEWLMDDESEEES